MEQNVPLQLLLKPDETRGNTDNVFPPHYLVRMLSARDSWFTTWWDREI